MNKYIIFGLVAVVVFIAGAMIGSKFGWVLKGARPAPAIEIDGTGGFLALLDKRMASRNFNGAAIDDAMTSEILWAAFGFNSRGTRVIPTAMNEQNLKVYAIRADGAFLYDGQKLVRVSDADLRPLFAQQDFVMAAPLTILYAGSDAVYSALHAGSAYQNVALYAAERGLGNVVRAFFDKDGVQRALGFAPGEFAIISQTIGFVK